MTNARPIAGKRSRARQLWIVLAVMASAELFGAHAIAQVVIIANPSLKVSGISKSALKDVFLGNISSLPDGTHLTPVLLKGGLAHSEFVAEYMGKTEAAFRSGWHSLVFSGEGTMPKQMASDAAMVQYVAHHAGAIGYIGKGSAHEGVKVLAVK